MLRFSVIFLSIFIITKINAVFHPALEEFSAQEIVGFRHSLQRASEGGLHIQPLTSTQTLFCVSSHQVDSAETAESSDQAIVLTLDEDKRDWGDDVNLKTFFESLISRDELDTPAFASREFIIVGSGITSVHFATYFVEQLRSRGFKFETKDNQVKVITFFVKPGKEQKVTKQLEEDIGSYNFLNFVSWIQYKMNNFIAPGIPIALTFSEGLDSQKSLRIVAGTSVGIIGGGLLGNIPGAAIGALTTFLPSFLAEQKNPAISDRVIEKAFLFAKNNYLTRSTSWDTSIGNVGIPGFFSTNRGIGEWLYNKLT